MDDRHITPEEYQRLLQLTGDLAGTKQSRLLKELQNEIDSTPMGDSDELSHTQAMNLKDLLPPELLQELKTLDLKNTPLRQRLLEQLKIYISRLKSK